MGATFRSTRRFSGWEKGERGAVAFAAFAGFALALTGCGGGAYPSAKAAPYVVAGHLSGDPGAPSVQSAYVAATSKEESDDGMPEPPMQPKAAPDAPPSPFLGSAAGAAPVEASPAGVVATLPRNDEVRERPADGSMIVYTASVTLAVYQVDAGLAAVELRARDLGGYLAKRNDTSVTVRIPRDRFRDALAAVEKLGDVVHRQIDAQDVSGEYVDLEARARNAKVTRDRLEELLKKAAVKEAIEIQKELARVTEELERIEGQLKLLRSKFAYATLTVTFAARPVVNPARTNVELPFPWLSELGLGRLLTLTR